MVKVKISQSVPEAAHIIRESPAENGGEGIMRL